MPAGVVDVGRGWRRRRRSRHHGTLVGWIVALVRRQGAEQIQLEVVRRKPAQGFLGSGLGRRALIERTARTRQCIRWGAESSWDGFCNFMLSGKGIPARRKPGYQHRARSEKRGAITKGYRYACHGPKQANNCAGKKSPIPLTVASTPNAMPWCASPTSFAHANLPALLDADINTARTNTAPSIQTLAASLRTVAFFCSWRTDKSTRPVCRPRTALFTPGSTAQVRVGTEGVFNLREAVAGGQDGVEIRFDRRPHTGRFEPFGAIEGILTIACQKPVVSNRVAMRLEF